MRQLYPPAHSDAAPLDLATVYAYPHRLDRPWVRANMVSSIDGAGSVDGHSAGLSSPPDKQIFALLRAQADVVLVGAGTARAEAYGPGGFERSTHRCAPAAISLLTYRSPSSHEVSIST